MKPEQMNPAELAGDSGAIRNVGVEDLPGLLRQDMLAYKKNGAVPARLYALIDLARLYDRQREEVIGKLEDFRYELLLDDPRYEQLKWHGALLLSGLKGGDAALLEKWGRYNSDIISAWIVAKGDLDSLKRHFCEATFAYDMENARYLLRYYDPLITPVLYRLADRKWVRWFFAPMVSWWYPVLAQGEVSWHRLGGGALVSPELAKRYISQEAQQLVLSEELWDALAHDPLPYRLLEVMERTEPQVFKGDSCYGVRLARIETLLEEAQRQGLAKRSDLVLYVYAMMQTAGLAEDARWQDAVRCAAAGERSLDAYFD